MANKVITINRSFGSRGAGLGQKLAKELGIHYYDKELIRIVSEQEGIPYAELMAVDEKRTNHWRLPIGGVVQTDQQYHSGSMNDTLFKAESDAIVSLAERENCVIVGRCANHVLKRECCSIFIHAPLEHRIKNLVESLEITEKAARSMIKKADKERRSYYEYFTEEKWLDMGQYDLCIDSSRFTTDEIIHMMKALYEKM